MKSVSRDGAAAGSRNLRGGLVLLSIGLAGGLAMSLYAFEPIVRAPASLQHYDDLPGDGSILVVVLSHQETLAVRCHVVVG